MRVQIADLGPGCGVAGITELRASVRLRITIDLGTVVLGGTVELGGTVVLGGGTGLV